MAVPVVAGPVGSGFTYQGELQQLGGPADGVFDFEFNLYDVSVDGVALTAPSFLEGVNVQDGVFTVELDFGAAAFDGTQLWLDIAVRESGTGATYMELSPRQKISPVPYALYAANVGSGGGQSDRIPYQEYFKVSFEAGEGQSDFIALAVDEEKRLVVNYIFVDGADNSSRTAFALYVNHTSPAVYDYLEWWNLPGDESPVGSFYYLHSIHQPTLVYIEPGMPTDFRIFRYKIGVESGTYHVGFAGYYETP
jgi:hypothetical protein